MEKAIYSLIGTGMYLLLSNQRLYKYTDRYGRSIYNCNNANYHLLATLGFFLVCCIMMVLIRFVKNKMIKNDIDIDHDRNVSYLQVVKYSIYSALIFYLVSNKEMYLFTNQFTGLRTLLNNMCPTNTGLILHSIVYFLIILSMMYLPK